MSASPPSPHRSAPIDLLDVKMHVVRPTDPVLGKVVRTVPCTARKSAGFVRHVDIDLSGTPLAGTFVPGQSFGVIPPGVDAHNKPHKVRLYSVASPTRGEDGGASGTPGSVISTTVKRTIDEHWETHRLFLGVASNFLCDAQVGDTVPVSGPNGKRFVLPARPREHDYLFVATGTGIAPFRGMVIDLLESGTKSNITLLMGSPYATDLLYDGFFRELAVTHPNFTYLTAISRERQLDDDGGPMYVQDRLRAERERLSPLLGGDRTLVYVCGVAGMELGIFEELARQLDGVALEQYLGVDPDALAALRTGPPGKPVWARAMIHKQVRPTRRVFLEVYA
jgi:ferredoxin--NADP+ reductase